MLEELTLDVIVERVDVIVEVLDDMQLEDMQLDDMQLDDMLEGLGLALTIKQVKQI